MYKQFWQTIGREAFWLLLGQVLIALAGLFAIRTLTGYFPREVYGLSWLFINGAGLAMMLLTGPLGQALNRFYYDKSGQDQLDKLLGLIWRFQIGITLIVGAFYFILIMPFGHLRGDKWLAFGIMPFYFFFLSFLGTAQGLLNISRQRGRRAILMVTEAWLKPIAAVLMYYLWRPDVNSFVIGYAVATILISIVGLTWMTSYGSLPPLKLPMPDKKYTRLVIAYSFPLIGFAGCNWILSLSDRYLINWFLGSTLTGTYIAAYQVGSAFFQLLGGVFGPLVQPIIFQRATKSNTSGAESISAFVRAFAWISLPVLAIFIIMHVWLMRWLVDPAYWNGIKAVLWIGLGAYFWILGNVAMNAFLVAKKNVPMMKIYSASVIVNIVLNLLLIPRMGIVGAGISTCLAYCFYAICTILWGRQILHWQFPMHSFLIITAISSAAGLSSKLIHSLVFDGQYSTPAGLGVLCVFSIVLISSTGIFWSYLQRDYGIVINNI